MFTDPTLDNDYEAEEESEHESIVFVDVLVHKPITYVLGKPIVNNKVGKVKRPVIFKGTSKGWVSESYVCGLTNKYVSNETWDCIEEKWLKCDMKDVEVYWDEDDFMSRIAEINDNNPHYNEYSNAFQDRALDLNNEVALLKQRIEL